MLAEALKQREGHSVNAVSGKFNLEEGQLRTHLTRSNKGLTRLTIRLEMMRKARTFAFYPCRLKGAHGIDFDLR